MAVFNPDTSVNLGDNYTTRSQGTTPNKALGYLFGGLADSVEDFTPQMNKGTGFVFEKYDPFSLTIAIIRATEIYKQKKEWSKLMSHAMSKDFSWQKSAKEYLGLFEMALRFHKER